MGAHLLQEKLDKCRDLLSTFLCTHRVTHQEIQSLIGFLSFACAVVVPGQGFLHRLIDLIIGVRKPHSLIRLSKEVKEDLLVWQLFHSGFNGHSFFLADQWKNSHQLELYLTPLVPWVMVLSWVDIGVMVNSRIAGIM